jgi:hypothetical protein
MHTWCWHSLGVIWSKSTGIRALSTAVEPLLVTAASSFARAQERWEFVAGEHQAFTTLLRCYIQVSDNSRYVLPLLTALTAVHCPEPSTRLSHRQMLPSVRSRSNASPGTRYAQLQVYKPMFQCPTHFEVQEKPY